MPSQKGNEGYQKHKDEERQAGYSRRMSRMRDQDVQNRESLKLILLLAEPLKGGVSMQNIPRLSLPSISKAVVISEYIRNIFELLTRI